MYGLGKIDNAMEDEIPWFRPILSVITTPTYKLPKFCDQLLKPLTNNENKVKDSFLFSKDFLANALS